MNPFAGVVGHDAVCTLLAAELAFPSQAYLFVGPSNVGKGEVARRFAAALVADGDDAMFTRALEVGHPDVVSVAPEGRTAITVDQARAVVSGAVRSPLEADRKVFLMEEASLLNDEAANALLKTIEEPIASSYFVLVAESEHDLPPTIASRCRTVVFGRVPDDEIVAGLERLGVEHDEAVQAARISGGRPGLAVSLATEPATAAFREAWLRVPDVVTGHPGEAYVLVKEVTEATEPLLDAVKRRHEAENGAVYGDDVPRQVVDRQTRELARASDALYATGLEILASFYRDTAAAQLGADVYNTDVAVGSLTRITTEAAVRRAERVLETIGSLEANQRPSLALAALFIDLGADG